MISMDRVKKDIENVNKNAERTKNTVTSGHDNMAEFNLFKNEILPNDSRITIDDNLKKFIKED